MTAAAPPSLVPLVQEPFVYVTILALRFSIWHCRASIVGRELKCFRSCSLKLMLDLVRDLKGRNHLKLFYTGFNEHRAARIVIQVIFS